MDVNHELDVDIAKNRIVFKVSGFIREDALKQIGDDLMDAANKLKPGIETIVDISEFKPASPKVAADILKLQEELKEKGLEKLVLIAGSNRLAEKQIGKIGKQAGYEVFTASSIEEGKKILGD